MVFSSLAKGKAVQYVKLGACAACLLLLAAGTAEAKRFQEPTVQASERKDIRHTKVLPRRGTVEKLSEQVAAPQKKDVYPILPMPNEEDILGAPMASEEQCVKYLLSVNPHPQISVSPEELVSYYYEEGRREGVRPDVAFAQALKETGFFRYGGTVTEDQNNYCGLGTTSSEVKGAYFPTAELGVRAHIQHLLAYASPKEPAAELVDPRFMLVRSTYMGKLGRWGDLNGRWAVPGHGYGESILMMFRAILNQ